MEKKTKKAVRRRKPGIKTNKKRGVLEASSLGVAPEQVREARINPEVMAPAYAMSALTAPQNFVGGLNVFQRPLVSYRTAFWLGVGLGMLIVGVLGALIWQFVKVELVEAVVLGLTRS